MLISSDAIILKVTPYSESSLIARILTRELGKVTIIAKGARRPRSPFAALLDPMNLTHCHFYYKETRDIQTLKDIAQAASTGRLRTSLEKVSLGLSVIEIIDRVLTHRESAPILFRLVWRILEKYETSTGMEHLLYAFFLLQLAIRSGFRPNIERCSRCEAELVSGVMDMTSGDICCSNCLAHGDIRLESTVLGDIRMLEATHIDRLEDLSSLEPRMPVAIRFLLAFLQFHFEDISHLKSIKVLKQLGI